MFDSYTILKPLKDKMEIIENLCAYVPFNMFKKYSTKFYENKFLIDFRKYS